MQLVASKDPVTFSEAHKQAVKIQDLTKTKGEQGCSSVENDESVNQIQGNGTQNPYRGNYSGRGGRGRGAPRGAPTGRGGYNGNNGNGQPKGDNQQQNGTKPTCCTVVQHLWAPSRRLPQTNQSKRSMQGAERYNLLAKAETISSGRR